MWRQQWPRYVHFFRLVNRVLNPLCPQYTSHTYVPASNHGIELEAGNQTNGRTFLGDLISSGTARAVVAVALYTHQPRIRRSRTASPSATHLHSTRTRPGQPSPTHGCGHGSPNGGTGIRCRWSKCGVGGKGKDTGATAVQEKEQKQQKQQQQRPHAIMQQYLSARGATGEPWCTHTAPAATTALPTVALRHRGEAP